MLLSHRARRTGRREARITSIKTGIRGYYYQSHSHVVPVCRRLIGRKSRPRCLDDVWSCRSLRC